MDENDLKVCAAFQGFLVKELGFAPKVNLIGMSWGGSFSTRYAATYPQNVRRIYLDAPLLTPPNWHLTDDQLWSLEIPGFPELQKYGAEWYVNGPVRIATSMYGKDSRKIRIITSGVLSRHSKKSISSIHTRAWSLRRGRTSWADSAATGPRTPSASRGWNGKCGRADLRLLKYSGHILILPSPTSRSSRSVRRTIAAASSAHTSTAPH